MRLLVSSVTAIPFRAGEQDREAPLHPGDQRVQQSHMGLARRLGRIDHAEHLLPEGDVLANDVADALGLGDPADVGLVLEQAVVGRVDPTVNESSERAHR